MTKIAFWRLNNEGRLLSTYRLSDIKGFIYTLLVSIPLVFITVLFVLKLFAEKKYLSADFFLFEYIPLEAMVLLLTLCLAAIIAIVITKPDAYNNTSIYFSIVIPALTYAKNSNHYNNYNTKNDMKDIKHINDIYYLLVLYKKFVILSIVVGLSLFLITDLIYYYNIEQAIINGHTNYYYDNIFVKPSTAIKIIRDAKEVIN